MTSRVGLSMTFPCGIDDDKGPDETIERAEVEQRINSEHCYDSGATTSKGHLLKLYLRVGRRSSDFGYYLTESAKKVKQGDIFLGMIPHPCMAEIHPRNFRRQRDTSGE